LDDHALFKTPSNVACSQDGQTIVTGGTGGALSFFDAKSLAREGDRLPVGAASFGGGLFAWQGPNGTVVGFASDPSHKDSDLERWFTLSVDPATLVRTACGLAGADITQAQWQRYVGDRPYRSVCTAATNAAG
jgi:hypothetical protein